jgi:hypothetical protein
MCFMCLSGCVPLSLRLKVFLFPPVSALIPALALLCSLALNAAADKFPHLERTSNSASTATTCCVGAAEKDTEVLVFVVHRSVRSSGAA